MNLDKNKYLVVFSGGQDSTSCLHWAIDKVKASNPNLKVSDLKDYIKLVTFNYGQRHGIEIQAAKKIAELNKLEFDLVDIPQILRGSSSLTNKDIDLNKKKELAEFETGIANTFVPGRNMLFLTLAANFAYSYGLANIVTGVCETDFAGYYDCRNEFIKSMQVTINQALFGSDEAIEIITPLMFLNKAETVKLANDLGADCMESLAYSHTCYEGKFPPCGECHACHLRARGFKDAKIVDPLIARAEKENLLNETSCK
ncbi:MAG: 7-cyano-7-deazaguanine synthase QueC [Candidatus Caenarcaniphilales bacterium]|nr:7-cyano-7-deazaguanine synthase QueC [Candidatus Caenarcaniphilales bacterium]